MCVTAQPFNTGYSPLNYSGVNNNPGVNWRILRGGVSAYLDIERSAELHTGSSNEALRTLGSVPAGRTGR